MTMRQDKVSEVITQLASTFFSQESNRTSLITVTRSTVSSDFKKATIYISVFPDTEEDAALNFCKRKLSDFRAFAKPKMAMKRIPFFDCAIDLGEKNRQHIDELSQDS